MTRHTRGACAVIGLAAVALMVASGSAGATRAIAVPSKVSIKSSSLHFTGQVSTGAYEPCEQQRKVVLFKAISGGPDQAVGRAMTSNHGAWSITPQGSAGISLASFYATVKKSSQGTAGTIYVCNAGRSRVVKPTS
jgi:hypothetical protein